MNINKPLSKVPAARRLDLRVKWDDAMRPSAIPATTRGRVFTSKGNTTFVIWDGEKRPSPVFTGALVTA